MVRPARCGSGRRHDGVAFTRDRVPMRSIPTLLRGVAMPFVLGLAAVLAALTASGASEGANDGPCRDVTHLGDEYWVCSFDPARHRVTMHAADADGRPYRRLGNATRALGPALMSVNGGMYRRDLSPLGLYVEDGEERRPLITGDGYGNFHLLPNGVFHVSDGEEGQVFGVTETLAYREAAPEVTFATQSGPMLVIDGALHPRFLPRSDSLKVRNGVGVDADGGVHFAISRGRVRFHDFGTLFRDVLGTPNALYLDGTISAFEAGERRRSTFMPIGPIIRMTAKEAVEDDADPANRADGS